MKALNNFSEISNDYSEVYCCGEAFGPSVCNAQIVRKDIITEYTWEAPSEIVLNVSKCINVFVEPIQAKNGGYIAVDIESANIGTSVNKCISE